MVVHIADQQLVRHLTHDPKAGWLPASNNRDTAALPTERWPDEAQMVGEVRWTGRSFT